MASAWYFIFYMLYFFFSYRVKETPPPPKSKFRLFYLLIAIKDQKVIVTRILCMNSSLHFFPMVLWQDVRLVENNLIAGQPVGLLLVSFSLVRKYRGDEDNFQSHCFCSHQILCGYWVTTPKTKITCGRKERIGYPPGAPYFYIASGLLLSFLLQSPILVSWSCSCSFLKKKYRSLNPRSHAAGSSYHPGVVTQHPYRIW